GVLAELDGQVEAGSGDQHRERQDDQDDHQDIAENRGHLLCGALGSRIVPGSRWERPWPQGDARLDRRRARSRRTRLITHQAIRASRIRARTTRIGAKIATRLRPRAPLSSATLATGAPVPAVVVLTTGRAAVFSRWTARAMTMPSTQPIHGFSAIQVELSSPAAALVALNTTPPEAGRIAVWITSFTVSTAGTLSSTNSAARSSAS